MHRPLVEFTCVLVFFSLFYSIRFQVLDASEDERDDFPDNNMLYSNSPRSCWIRNSFVDCKNEEYFKTCIKIREYPDIFE